jgi:glycosyltransferase involved in cell wall biosynthesis
MNTQPLVSIIIPTYNRAHLIEETLDSVMDQTYQNWECIIVDDGSNDNTDEVVGEYVKKDSRFKYFHRPDEHLSGGNGARNYGFKMSHGDYIQWFDSDDLMMPEKLDLKVKKLYENDVDFVFSNFELFDTKRIYNTYSAKITKKNILQSFLIKEIGLATPQPLIKKKVLDNYSICFNENLRRGQELMYFTKFLYFSRDFLFIDKVLFKYRIDFKSKDKVDKKRTLYLLEAHVEVFKFLDKKSERKLLIDFFNIRMKKYLLRSLRDDVYTYYNIMSTLINETKIFRLRFRVLSFFGKILITVNYRGYNFYKKIFALND